MTVAVAPYTGPPDRWDALARSAAGGTFCHAWGWRRVMMDVFGHECTYLSASDASGPRGILPLVRVRSRLFGHYLVSMPFLNYGGPLGDDEAVRALAAHAADRARAERVTLLELRSRVAVPTDLAVSHRKITVVLDLPSHDPDALWRAMEPKLRSQIRRPRKEGVTVAFGPEHLEPFYAVFARHMRDLGTPVLSRRLFEAIRAEFGESVWFGCAHLAGKPVAAGCGFRWGGEFEMTWAAALREHQRIAPNMLLYWSFLERAVEQRLSRFNFGRCTPGSGTHRFKRQWGARDEMLHWYQFTARGPAATPSPDDGRYRLATRVWSRLPLGVANRLGPHLVRLIP